MPEQKRSATLIKFGMYLLAVVLINMAGLTLFARFDLTRDKILSLSEASRKVVSTLSEPLTIDVFYSRNLPPPYNNVEHYLRDLLEEYAVYNQKFFNYRFHDVSAEEGDISAEARDNQKLASSYGIHPIQVQAIEKDEVKFQRAYMGLVLIHGDLIEQMPTITTTDGLEYRITTAIQKMNRKISALLRLPDKINVKLVLSSSLNAVAPFMGLKTLSHLPAEIEQAVKALNARTYGKLAYAFSDPAADSDLQQISKTDNLLLLTWPATADGKVTAGQGVIGLLVEHGGRKIALPLIDVVRLPIVGTQYKLLGAEDVSKMLNNSVESLVEIHEGLGVLADHRTAPIMGGSPGSPQDDPQAYSNFREQIALNYALKPVALAQDPIPENIACLLVVNPREKFTDYDLYQIDQFLMQGKSLALFVEAFEETMVAPNQPPTYRPLETGLERLLEHYGVRVRRAYVLDENCYRQPMPPQMGGGERPVYYAPLIKRQFMNQALPFMKSIKGLVAVKASPLDLTPAESRPKNLAAHLLFASSEKSWEIKDRISLDPMALRPPTSAAEMHSRPLAYLLEGEFSSYFAGKPLPVREVAQPKEDAAATPAPAAQPPQIDLSKIERQGQFIAQGKPGKIFVLASADMLKNMVIDENGRGPNTVFVLNAIDYLNQRGDVAVMRAKEQTFNPLSETSAGERTFIKSFIIAGLPLLVALFGIGVWVRRAARKKRIQAMFASPSA
ncbi:MAG TPA: Gldg family protein [Desulfobacterales bacterium]|nr:Gldg family protein [Desulfobacterales bacterium]